MRHGRTPVQAISTPGTSIRRTTTSGVMRTDTAIRGIIFIRSRRLSFSISPFVATPTHLKSPPAVDLDGMCAHPVVGMTRFQFEKPLSHSQQVRPDLYRLRQGVYQRFAERAPVW